MKKYDFYLSVRDIGGALGCIDDAIYMANREGHLDLQAKMEGIMYVAFPKRAK